MPFPRTLSHLAGAPGQLYAFGNNASGQLGSATNAGTSNPNPTPTLVGLPGATGGATQIAAGGGHNLAVTSTGQLYAFGGNAYGQLGSAANGNPNPTPTLVTLPGATGRVAQIAAGAFHSLALTSTGQLYAFGSNASGQLGSAANGNPNPTPTLVALAGATGPATQIAAGGGHSLAVTSTGQVYAFGDNFYGQLGSATNNGTGNANPTPTIVVLAGATGPVTQIAAGAFHSLAVTSTGQLYAFGYNLYGQLGSAINSGTSAANPTPLLGAMPPGLAAAAVASSEGANGTLVVLTTPPPPPPPPPPPSPGTTAAVLSAFRASPRPLSLAGRLIGGHCVKPTRRSGNHKHCTLPIALKLTYTLNVAATVTFTLTRQDPGRKVHGRCLKVTRGNGNHARCARLSTLAGALAHTSTAGANTFTFDGRIGGNTLKPGTYVLTATPTSNGRPGIPRSATIKLVG